MIGLCAMGTGAAADMSCPQQCLYFLPLPQGHGSFRPGGLGFTSAIVAWFAAGLRSRRTRLNGVHQGEQCCQLAQVGLIVTPSSDRGRADLLPYLPLARSRDTATRLRKVETAPIPCKPQVRNQPTAPRFRIG